MAHYCPTCKTPDTDVQYYGYGTGITPGQTPGESFLHGRKVVGWQGETPVTFDPATGQMFVHTVNMETGEYTEGIAMPTTVAARHGWGRGPIATAPVGSGRTFWSPSGVTDMALLYGGVMVAGAVILGLMLRK